MSKLTGKNAAHSCHLGHDFRTIDEEEEGTGLIGYCSGHKGLTGTRGTEHKYTSWRLDTDTLEQLRMSQRKFHHLSDLSHLFPASSDIIVTNIGKVCLFVLSLDGITLGVDDGILCNYTVLCRIGLDYLELDSASSTSSNEGIAFSHRAVGWITRLAWIMTEVLAMLTFEKVGLKEDFEDITGQTCFQERCQYNACLDLSSSDTHPPRCHRREEREFAFRT